MSDRAGVTPARAWYRVAVRLELPDLRVLEAGKAYELDVAEASAYCMLRRLPERPDDGTAAVPQRLRQIYRPSAARDRATTDYDPLDR
jgi:hypothetical protein